VLITAGGCGNQNKDAGATTVVPVVPEKAVMPSEAAPQSFRIAKGTVLPVSLGTLLDSSIEFGLVPGTAAENVKGSDGAVAIPAGSPVVMLCRYMGRKGPISELIIGLQSIRVGGRNFALTDGATDAATVKFREDAGLGPGHSSVHLDFGTVIEFKLDRAIDLR
jgi:hypothetical protein